MSHNERDLGKLSKRSKKDQMKLKHPAQKNKTEKPYIIEAPFFGKMHPS